MDIRGAAPAGRRAVVRFDRRILREDLSPISRDTVTLAHDVDLAQRCRELQRVDAIGLRVRARGASEPREKRHQRRRRRDREGKQQQDLGWVPRFVIPPQRLLGCLVQSQFGPWRQGDSLEDSRGQRVVYKATNYQAVTTKSRAPSAS